MDIKFSKPGKYLIFRALRFPTLMNPYSLADESFAQTELRKVSRQKEKPTRIYSESKKNGNPKRSGTLVVPNQSLFGCVGYSLIKKDLKNAHHFSEDMNRAQTGYGKDREYIKQDKSSIQQNVDKFLRTNKYNKYGVNEIVLDVESPEDISFVYYTIDKSHWADKDGMETNCIESRRLSSIFLKKEIEKNFNISVPIYEYCMKDNKLKHFNYTDKDLNALLIDAFSNRNNNRNLLPIALTFKDTIKADPYLLKKVKSNLSWQEFKYRFGFYDNTYQNHFGFSKTYKNQAIFNINCLIKLSKTLKEYDLKEKSIYVAKETLKLLIKLYTIKDQEIYKKRPKCSHEDIHTRTFNMLLKECENLMPKNDFEKYNSDIKKAFNSIKEYTKLEKNSKNEIFENDRRKNKMEPHL